jgi:hypothetical protein
LNLWSLVREPPQLAVSRHGSMISAPARIIAVIIDAVFPLLKVHGGRATSKPNSFDQHGLVALEFHFHHELSRLFLDFLKCCGDFLESCRFILSQTPLQLPHEK